jgi:hypothetical protein
MRHYLRVAWSSYWLAGACVLLGAIGVPATEKPLSTLTANQATAQRADDLPGTILLRGKCLGPGDLVFKVDMTLEANGFGELVGKGRYEMDYSIDGPGHEWVGDKKVPVDKFRFHGDLDFNVKGTFADKTVTIAGPVNMVMVSKVSKDKSTIPLPPQMRNFKGTLTPDPQTGVGTYKGLVEFRVVPTDPVWKMATIITGNLPKIQPVQVAIQYPIQPGIPRIKNQVTFVLPKSATFPEGKKYTVEARTQPSPSNQWARLWTDGDEIKRFKLRFENVKPGQSLCHRRKPQARRLRRFRCRHGVQDRGSEATQTWAARDAEAIRPAYLRG